jgi:hypothetical protein
MKFTRKLMSIIMVTRMKGMVSWRKSIGSQGGDRVYLEGGKVDKKERGGHFH